MQFLIVVLLLKILGFFIIRTVKPIARVSKKDRIDPPIDIIVPMYNEEKVILKTVYNLLNITYSNFKIIVIDDGSTDNSLALVKEHFAGNDSVHIINTINRGKAQALNVAMAASTSEIVFCIDADTLVLPNIVDVILPHFDDQLVVAVAGTIKVGNPGNLITKMQCLEYMTTQNFERKVFSLINGIMVVPGAIGAFKRSVISNLGGYTSDTLTEDTEITVKIICNNYLIKNASDAVGFTEAPASSRMFLKQRIRWKVGTMQVLVKYMKDAFFHKNKAISFLVIPYTWIFGVFLPFISPIADYYVTVALLVNKSYDILIYYLVFVLIDAATCFIILIENGESQNFFQCILLRFLLRQLTFVSYLMIFFRFFNGNLNEWGKVIRYGSVSLNANKK
ncbi:glycosyltransferase [Pedobacter sp. WC2423]|uniref:glycosyltransferase family 2 protein n=1 Tax=Pedobacter sp. WC2423 TaxID=3234142 RepID=UPI003464FF72